MLNIEEKIDLTPYTTLKIGDLADYFAVISKESDLLEALDFSHDKSLPIFILGGGSNILISKPMKALVLKNELKGIEIVKETDEEVFLEGMSGELWSSFVYFAVSHNWGGIENLYYVPGTVGAAPVQNIGAYGVELKDVFISLRALDLQTGETKIFELADCHFAYRDSVFKKEFKNRYFIISVVVKLQKNPQLKLDYGDILSRLAERKIEKPDLKIVANLIKEIRDSKLPNPSILPNAGSFFKNPEISQQAFKNLQEKFPDIKFFPGSQADLIKIPAGWLIEEAGFKGKRYGNLAMYEKQALILVNYGSASASEALEHISRVQTGVWKKFGIKIEPEVNII